MKLPWDKRGFAKTAHGTYSIAKQIIREGNTNTIEFPVLILGKQDRLGIGGSKQEAKRIAQAHYDNQQR